MEPATKIAGTEARVTYGRTVLPQRLPHWRADRAMYFVTWRLAKDQPDLTPPERDLVMQTLRHSQGERYELTAFVVMNDHIHVLLYLRESYCLEDVIQSWKSFTANRMQRDHGRRGQVWQAEYFDRIVRDENELAHKYNYIQGNPWTRWNRLESYQWVWPGDV